MRINIKYKSTNAVLMRLEEGSDYLSTKNLDKTKEAIDKGKVLLLERQKLIRLADKPPFGWKTVLEYKKHDLAEDEEDEKKIYRAEARAAREYKKFSSPRFNKFDRNTRSVVPPTTNLHPNSYLHFNSTQPSYKSPYRASGVCFSCGKPGHWRAACPLLLASRQKQDT